MLPVSLVHIAHRYLVLVIQSCPLVGDDVRLIFICKVYAFEALDQSQDRTF
jgi:hypothetical protein